MGIFSKNHITFKVLSKEYDVKVNVYTDYGFDPIVRGPAQDGSYTTISTWELSDGIKAHIKNNVVYVREDCDLFDNLIDESTKYLKDKIEIVSDITSTTSTPGYGTYHVMLEVQPKYYYKTFRVGICLEKSFS